MQRGIVAARPAHQFQRDIGDDLVGVHVGRGAGAALHRIDHELIEEAPLLGDQRAGAIDRVGLFGRQMAKPPVGARRRLLDQRQGAHEFGEMPDRNAGDREILDRPQGVDAPIGVGRDIGLAEEIVLAARRERMKLERTRADELQHCRLWRFCDGLIEISLCHGAIHFFVREWSALAFDPNLRCSAAGVSNR